MRFDVRLEKGRRYNTAYLRVSRWVPFYAKSRNKLEFFADGAYLGPDDDGTEPLFLSGSVRRALGDFGQLVEVERWKVLRPATEGEWLLYWRKILKNSAWCMPVDGHECVIQYDGETVVR